MNLNFPTLFCSRFPRLEDKRAGNSKKIFVVLYPIFLYTLGTTFSKTFILINQKTHTQQTAQFAVKIKLQIQAGSYVNCSSATEKCVQTCMESDWEKKICSAFLDRHIVNVLCYYFYNIFWSLKQELQRIQQQRT